MTILCKQLGYTRRAKAAIKFSQIPNIKTRLSSRCEMGNWVIWVGEWRESFPNINCVLKTYSKKSDYHNICYKEKAVYEANRHPPSLSPPSTPLMPVTVLVMQSLSLALTHRGKKKQGRVACSRHSISSSSRCILRHLSCTDFRQFLALALCKHHKNGPKLDGRARILYRTALQQYTPASVGQKPMPTVPQGCTVPD